MHTHTHTHISRKGVLKCEITMALVRFWLYTKKI